MSSLDRIAIRGTLVSTDVPAKIMIGRINDARKESSRPAIILKDLDDTHVLIESTEQERVRDEVERLFDQQNIYTLPTASSQRNTMPQKKR